jgi:Ca2+-binding EF-hand superfamily protein
MVRVLTKRGLNLEDYYRQRDADRMGLIPKKQFLSSLRHLGLPFSLKELAEMTQHYTQPASEFVDYVSFLKDARIYRRSAAQVDANKLSSSAKTSGSSLGEHAMVLQLVKRMLLDAIKSLGKHPDEVYRMFARWDAQGTGTVTATQFLRVLARLHVELSELDQDFLVELLDTNAMGRIDFDALLSHCLGASEQDMQSPHGMLIGAGIDDGAGETLSAVSTEGNSSLELRSSSSNLGAIRRPHTASLSRPYNSSLPGNGHDTNPQSSPGARVESSADSSQHRYQHASSAMNSFANTQLRGVARVRPLTASGRVLAHSFQHNAQGSRRSTGGAGLEGEDVQLMDLPDDVINGEENYLPSDPSREEDVAVKAQCADEEFKALLFEDAPPMRSSPDSRDFLTLRQYLPAETEGESQAAPTDHLVLLATQILSTLRDIILARYRRGRSLLEIFQHFDRNSKRFFGARDFIEATADLRIETSEHVADIAVGMLAIDGGGQVSFGEFKVFVLDADHKLLELNVQEQLAGLFEQQGREYQTWMGDVFWTEDEAANDSRGGAKSVGGRERDLDAGFVTKSAFVSALRKIGLVLSSAEVTRLVDRFDIHGTGNCSATRFIRMVQHGSAWRHAESVLRFQDQAFEEAQFLRKQMSSQGTNKQLLPLLSEELISMCEYLGICVLSEQNMIWISADALKAPLPVNWTAQKDSYNRIFFFNRLTGQSKWEHPLDPHFRKLRDKYRQR